MAKKYWLPKTRIGQFGVIQNFRSKIGGYASALNLTPAQIAEIEQVCDSFLAAFSYTEQCKATMHAVTEWRELVIEGDETDESNPPAPVFPTPPVVIGTRGVIKQFSAFRNMIVRLPGYSPSIGYDLGIIGSETQKLTESDASPDLKVAPINDFRVKLAGSMLNMEAMRVEYKPNGGTWSNAAFLTKLPAEIMISPVSEGQPETGSLRAVFIKANADFGSFSPTYPVTVS